mmetsp:Transcript_31086/g.65920  ORF Transcript_31086/g.65920 Transcript_31086/m.65920 type:complete len:211 (+) Transcript_31086:371-1003(+)|eukprot:CAMPEP_0204348264 /NCGR_PEP_ID=MMETSP0469-20131031/28584_1 /ASSEMBLY_ACC=CAM_ASM_000384 /TAXON_ID=2969 /ORGANISM="Oxyrrhis marina" /LENGTH=210 /DNA_ID=CAMNT_0051334197 /DNA_START=602 /DNA_END=1237 /DNA_ORIENTATION=-
MGEVDVDHCHHHPLLGLHPLQQVPHDHGVAQGQRENCLDVFGDVTAPMHELDCKPDLVASILICQQVQRPAEVEGNQGVPSPRTPALAVPESQEGLIPRSRRHHKGLVAGLVGGGGRGGLPIGALLLLLLGQGLRNLGAAHGALGPADHPCSCLHQGHSLGNHVLKLPTIVVETLKENKKKRSPPAAARGTFVGGRTSSSREELGDDRNK